jgi:hypothetical protein
MENLKVVNKGSAKAKTLHADTVVTIVIDGSGSMNSITDATLEGYNAFINKQREEDGDVLVSLVIFDSTWARDKNGHTIYGEQETRLRRPYTALELDDVPELTRDVYKADGGTPLRDAIGKSIGFTDDILQRIPSDENPDALMVIITDGGENTSQDYGAGLIKEMIAAREEAGWTFIYMGANQDSWSETQNLGFKQGNVMNYAAHDIKEGAFAKVAASTVAYRGLSNSAKADGLVGSYATTSFFSDAGVTEDAPVESSTDAKTDA